MHSPVCVWSDAQLEQATRFASGVREVKCTPDLHCRSSKAHRAAVVGPIPLATTMTGLPRRVPYAILRQKLLLVTFTLFCRLAR